MSVTRFSRCKHLEKALSESTKRVQELEATNSLLEKKLVTLPLICIINMSEATLSCIFLALYLFTFVFPRVRLNGQSATQWQVLP